MLTADAGAPYLKVVNGKQGIYLIYVIAEAGRASYLCIIRS